MVTCALDWRTRDSPKLLHSLYAGLRAWGNSSDRITRAPLGCAPRESPWHKRCPTCYPTLVRKTSVYLDEADARRLAMLAEREGVSQASLLRQAIRAYVPQPRESRTFMLDGVGEGPGGSVADVDTSTLLEGFGG